MVNYIRYMSYCGHFQTGIQFWSFSWMENCFIFLGVSNHANCLVIFSRSKLRYKSYKKGAIKNPRSYIDKEH